jgi:hypothetical protein
VRTRTARNLPTSLREEQRIFEFIIRVVRLVGYWNAAQWAIYELILLWYTLWSNLGKVSHSEMKTPLTLINTALCTRVAIWRVGVSKHISGLHAIQHCRWFTQFTVHRYTRTRKDSQWLLTTRILATDLSQPHCHFKSYIKSSCHSLVPFLPLQMPIPKTRLHSVPSSYPGRLAPESRPFTSGSTTLLLLLRRVFCVVL